MLKREMEGARRHYHRHRLRILQQNFRKYIRKTLTENSERDVPLVDVSADKARSTATRP